MEKSRKKKLKKKKKEEKRRRKEEANRNNQAKPVEDPSAKLEAILSRHRPKSKRSSYKPKPKQFKLIPQKPI